MCGIPMMMPPEDSGPTSKMPLARVMAHAGAPEEAGPEQNRALLDAATAERLRGLFQDYIWMGKDGSGTCTACGEAVNATYGWSKEWHKNWIKCPICGKQVQLRWKRYGHKNLKKEFCAVTWRKSAIEKNAAVMIGYSCEMDSSGAHPENAQKEIYPVLVDVFRYGKGAVRWQRCVEEWGVRKGECKWHRQSCVNAIGGSYFGRKVLVYRDVDGFAAAIHATPFVSALEALDAAKKTPGAQWSRIYDEADGSLAMDAIARRPWVEYMAKSGFLSLALAACGSTEQGLLNPKGKTVRQILKLNPNRYSELRSRRENISTEELAMIQSIDAAGIACKLPVLKLIHSHCGLWTWRQLLVSYGAPDRALLKYLKRNEGLTLRDYWRMCGRAGVDLSAPDARFPRDLRQAHDRIANLLNERARMRKEQKAAEFSDAIAKRLPALERKYGFAAGGLILRPARTGVELINEGNALKHCVGGYIESYAMGNTDICFLRRKDAPDVPWRTIEFDPRSGKRVQDRGYRNDWATGPNGEKTLTEEVKAELTAFWAAFEAWRNTTAKTAAASQQVMMEAC